MSLNQSNFEILDGVLCKYTGRSAEVVIPEGVWSIGWGAFADKKSIRSLVLPEGMLRIGVEAFAGCSELTTVTVPMSLESILSGAFAGCEKLTGLSLPEGVDVAPNAFEGCTSLGEIQ